MVVVGSTVYDKLFICSFTLPSFIESIIPIKSFYDGFYVCFMHDYQVGYMLVFQLNVLGCYKWCDLAQDNISNISRSKTGRDQLKIFYMWSV